MHRYERLCRHRRLLLAAATSFFAACSAESKNQPPSDGVADSAANATSTGAPSSASGSAASPDAKLPTADTAPHAPAAPSVALTPIADTIAQRLVFAPVMQKWFVAAARGKRLVVDLGRIDLELKKDSAHARAFQRAAEAHSPVAIGSHLHLRGDWGSDDATVKDFGVWNGRIVANLVVPPRVDSLAQSRDPLVASAERTTDVATPSDAACDHSSDSTIVERLKTIASAALDSLKAGDQPIYPRLKQSIHSRTSVVAGCFGTARGIAIATFYAGDYEWVRERVYLVDESGAAKKLTVRDLRFRAHEGLHAVDADGDGVDDLAARAWAQRSGGTVLLTLREGARLERLAAGFSWER
ncbi:MAG: hypothetical protein ABIT38_10175 [Gemmatimonadaceae bacterium]